MSKEDIPGIIAVAVIFYILGAISVLTANSPATWTEFPDEATHAACDTRHRLTDGENFR